MPIVVGILAVLAAGAYFLFQPKMQSVERLGKLQLGDSLPSFTAVSEKSQKNFTSTDPQGLFTLTILSNSLPNACLDMDCGSDALAAIQNGGHVMGFSDIKLRQLFGINEKQSLVIATDSSGIILSLYVNAGLANTNYLVGKVKQRL